MKLRHRKTHISAASNRFNVQALAEIDVGNDSMFISDLEVFVNGDWKDMNEAFRDRDIIPNNYNSTFDVPETEEDKKRGYSR